MSLDIQNMFGVFEKALTVHERRTDLISNNISNQDTPNYKAKDIDFREALAAENAKRGNSSSQTSLVQSQLNHLSMLPTHFSTNEKYRIPMSPSLDGNTVDSQQEIAKFSENALRYQANLNFIDGNISSLLLAFKGE